MIKLQKVSNIGDQIEKLSHPFILIVLQHCENQTKLKSYFKFRSFAIVISQNKTIQRTLNRHKRAFSWRNFKN